MDDFNLYKSFNDLLEENEGWILTKNEHGKIKIASCEEDESNIYEKTRDWIVVNIDQTRTDTLQLPKPELFKIANFFIRDLLNSEQQDGYFSFRNISYVNVFVCGTVVSLYVRNNKHYMIVDDGTSSIKCIISQEDLSILNQNEAADFSVEKGRSSKILQAAAMTIVSKNFVNLSVPEFSDLELGNIVKIIGSIVEYDGNRYIFTKKIVKEPKGTIFSLHKPREFDTFLYRNVGLNYFHNDWFFDFVSKHSERWRIRFIIITRKFTKNSKTD